MDAREVRKTVGLTKADVAILAGTGMATVSLYEQNPNACKEEAYYRLNYVYNLMRENPDVADTLPLQSLDIPRYWEVDDYRLSSGRKRICQCGAPRVDSYGRYTFSMLKKGRAACNLCGNKFPIKCRAIGALPTESIQSCIGLWSWLSIWIMLLSVFGVGMLASAPPARVTRRDDIVQVT